MLLTGLWLPLLLVFCGVLHGLVAASQSGDACHRKIVSGDNLDDALDHFLLSAAAECADVLLVLPGPGPFRLTRAHALNGTSRNITMRSESETRARISCEDFVPPAAEPFLLEFWDWHTVILQGLEFVDCRRGISVVDVENVVVENSYFRNISGGAVNIYDSYNVLVSGSSFESCTSRGQLTGLPLRALGGCLSLSCIGSRPQQTESYLTVRNCSFMRCVSRGSRRSLLAGRGGALAFSLLRANVTVSVEDSDFSHNNATLFGGAVVVLLYAPVPDYLFFFRRLRMIGNLVGLGGGALAMAPFDETRGSRDIHIRVFFEDCQFESNGGLFGSRAIRQSVPFVESRRRRQTNNLGGAMIISPQFSVINVTIRRSNFTDNSADRAGAALLVTPLALRSLGRAVLLSNVVIEDCVFSNNFGVQLGTFTAGQSRVFFRGRNVFRDNRGVAFGPILSLSVVEGELVFVGNTAGGLDGGAIYIADFSQIQLNRGADIQFINNSGNLGAGLVVKRPHYFRPYSRAFTNPLCFLQFEDPRVPPPQWDNVSITFDGNYAIMASGALVSSLELCSWRSYRTPLFDVQSFLTKWSFVHARDNVNTGHTNTSHQAWAIQTPALFENVSLLLPSTNKSTVYPGGEVPFQIGSWDEYGNPAVSFIQPHALSTSRPLEVEFQPQVVIHEPKASTLTFTYTVKTADSAAGTHILSQVEHVLEPVRNLREVDPFKFSIDVGTCPLGTSLQETTPGGGLSCRCDAGRTSSDFIGCEGQTLILKNGFWGSSYNDSGGVTKLQVYPCPNTYCRCFDPVAVARQSDSCRYVLDEDAPNNQCSCNRTGFLCGKCAEGNGVSTTFNRCAPCSLATLALIPALIIVDVLAVLAILHLLKYIPSLLYPTLFYIQTLPYVIREGYTLKVFQGIFYINEALSLYFPFDVCLFPGATALGMHGMRYIPLLVAVFVVCTQFIVRHILRRRGRRVNYEIGLWPLTLLLFNHIVYTSMAVVKCPLLVDYDGRRLPIWHLDGTVRCFSGAHLPLALFALVVLVCASLLALPLLRPVERRSLSFLKVFFKSAVSAYKKEWHWFGIVELGRRAGLIATALITSSSGGFWHLVLACVFFIYVYVQPYKKAAANVLEALLLFLLILLQYHVEYPDAITQSEKTPIPGEGLLGCQSVNAIAETQWFSVVAGLIFYLPVLIAGVAIILALTKHQCVKVLAAIKARRQRGQSSPQAESLPQRHFTEVVLSAFHLQEHMTHSMRSRSGSIPQGLLVREGEGSAVSEL